MRPADRRTGLRGQPRLGHRASFGVALAAVRLFAPWTALLLAALAGPAQATVLSDWSLEEVTQRADLIFIGTVVSAEAVEGDGTVLTASTLAVERTLYDAAHQARATVEVRELGGHLGKRWVDVPGTAGLTKGKRYLLFTFLHPDGHRYLVGMELGAYVFTGASRLEHTVDVPLIRRDGRLIEPPGPIGTTLEKVQAILRGLGR